MRSGLMIRMVVLSAVCLTPLSQTYAQGGVAVGPADTPPGASHPVAGRRVRDPKALEALRSARKAYAEATSFACDLTVERVVVSGEVPSPPSPPGAPRPVRLRATLAFEAPNRVAASAISPDRTEWADAGQTLRAATDGHKMGIWDRVAARRPGPLLMKPLWTDPRSGRQMIPAVFGPVGLGYDLCDVILLLQKVNPVEARGQSLGSVAFGPEGRMDGVAVRSVVVTLRTTRPATGPRQGGEAAGTVSDGAPPPGEVPVRRPPGAILRPGGGPTTTAGGDANASTITYYLGKEDHLLRRVERRVPTWKDARGRVVASVTVTQVYTNVRLNQPIPAATFAPPTAAPTPLALPPEWQQAAKTTPARLVN